MKDYTSNKPMYSDTIKIIETTDTTHAENVNVPLRQLLDNTAANHEAIEKCVQGSGLTFFVDNDGILNVTYDDGTEEGEEGTENEADNTGGRQGDIG